MQCDKKNQLVKDKSVKCFKRKHCFKNKCFNSKMGCFQTIKLKETYFLYTVKTAFL